MAQVSQYDPRACARTSTAPHVLLHGEPPALRAGPGPATARPLLLAGLLAAECPEERRRVVADMLRAMDFDWLAYGRLLCFGDRVQPLSLCTTHIDARWARHYCSQSYFDADPRIHDALQSSLPCGWTLEGLQQRLRDEPSRSPARRLLADLAATGMRGGAMLVLPGSSASERHFVSLLSRTGQHAWTDAGVLGQVLTLGLCLHEYYTRYTGLPAVDGPSANLTAVQRKILAHLARGAGDKQIAYDLQLSSHVVDYHMRQLRRRFGVRNRVQLMQAAQAVGCTAVPAAAPTELQ